MSRPQLPPTYPSILLEDTLAASGMYDLLTTFEAETVPDLLDWDDEDDLALAA